MSIELRPRRHTHAIVTLSALAGMICIVSSRAPSRAQVDEEITIQANGILYVLPNGNGRISMTYGFTPARAYDRVRRRYPNL